MPGKSIGARNERITIAKVDKYFQITSKALGIAQHAEKDETVAEWVSIVLDMASRYLQDADYFRKKGDLVLAFGALNYAHGWLDAGARLGFYKVKDSKLFTVDD